MQKARFFWATVLAFYLDDLLMQYLKRRNPGIALKPALLRFWAARGTVADVPTHKTCDGKLEVFCPAVVAREDACDCGEPWRQNPGKYAHVFRCRTNWRAHAQNCLAECGGNAKSMSGNSGTQLDSWDLGLVRSITVFNAALVIEAARAIKIQRTAAEATIDSSVYGRRVRNAGSWRMSKRIAKEMINSRWSFDSELDALQIGWFIRWAGG